MRVMSHSEALNPVMHKTVGFSLSFKVVFGIIALFFFMALLIVIRQQCLNEGYKISALSNKYDEIVLKHEEVAKRYSDALRWENLIQKSEGLDFTFPEGGRVFYVK